MYARQVHSRLEKLKRLSATECALRDSTGAVSEHLSRWRAGRASLRPGHIIFQPYVRGGFRIRARNIDPIQVPVLDIPEARIQKRLGISSVIATIDTGETQLEWSLVPVIAEWALSRVLQQPEPNADPDQRTETSDPNTWPAQLAGLARRDPDLTVFGASGHRYRLPAPLRHDQLLAIQDQYGFTVPDDYRAFVTTTGNGGPGPGYGLWPLGLWDPTDRHLEAWADGRWTDQPGRQFPHTAPWNLPGELLAEAPPEDAPWEELDAYADKADAANRQPGLTDGAIPIAHLGCAIWLMLIVTGPERGNIWIDDRASDAGIYPATTEQHAQRMTFADLYQDWITQADQFLESGERPPRLW